MASNQTVQYFLNREVVPGTLNTSPVWQPYPQIVGDDLQMKSNLVDSEVNMPQGAAAIPTIQSKQVGGSLTTHFFRSNATDLVIGTAIGNELATNTTKASTNMLYMSVEKRFIDSGLTYRKQFTGVQPGNLEISSKGGATVEMKNDMMGLTFTTAALTSGVTGATDAAPSTQRRLYGSHSTVMVANTTYPVLEYSLKIERNLGVVDLIGSDSINDLAVEGPRTVTLDLTLRQSNNQNGQTFNGLVGNATIQVGSGNYGYAFDLYNCSANYPEASYDGGQLYEKVTLKAAYHPDVDTDLIVRKL